MVKHFRDRTSYVVISLAWLIVILVINPIAEFPLNDDWSYALSVKSLALNGNLELWLDVDDSTLSSALGIFICKNIWLFLFNTSNLNLIFGHRRYFLYLQINVFS